jgi:uncharacterized Fe-S cluster protein YjdI
MDSGDRDYSNEEITVSWRPGKCVNSTVCYRELIEVFYPRKRPWVNMEGASTERIIEIVNKCPTEALTYRWKDESKNNTLNDKSNKINKSSETASQPGVKPVILQVMRDGPLVVQGSFEVYNSEGKLLKTMLMTSFCRCGHSNNAPFCDGFHRKIGYKSDQ